MSKQEKAVRKSKLLEKLIGAVVLIEDRTSPPEDPRRGDASPLLYGRLTDYDGEFVHLNPVARLLVGETEVFYPGHNVAFEEVLSGYKINGFKEYPGGCNIAVSEVCKIASFEPSKLHLHPEIKEDDPDYARKFYRFRRSLS